MDWKQGHQLSKAMGVKIASRKVRKGAKEDGFLGRFSKCVLPELETTGCDGVRRQPAEHSWDRQQLTERIRALYHSRATCPAH